MIKELFNGFFLLSIWLILPLVVTRYLTPILVELVWGYDLRHAWLGYGLVFPAALIFLTSMTISIILTFIIANKSRKVNSKRK